MYAIAGRVKVGRKFDQVVQGAREVFMRDGFEGASVDDIARAAGVSKATLYSYFPDKRLLFTEVVRGECRRQADIAVAEIDQDAAPRVVLRLAAVHMVRFYLSPYGISVYRIAVAESGRFPDFGRSFHESGPKHVEDILVEYLDRAAARGELVVPDARLAANQFAELCKADLFPRHLFGVQSEFSEAEIDRVVTGAVETFLARYGA